MTDRKQAVEGRTARRTTRRTAANAISDGVRLRAAKVFETLWETYGEHRWRSKGTPLDELIGTVLSQHTTNVNTARSFRSLRERFPTWEAVRDAPEDDVIDAIRSGGLATIKGPRIQAILRSISGRYDRLSLDRIEGMPIKDAKADLTALHGVGPKTAACVLLFSLGRPVMPVDTHVHRVSRRIGLVPPTTSAEATEPLLEELLGPNSDRILTAHLNLIQHGQTVCLARRPRCEACPVQSECDYYKASPAQDRAHR